MSRAAAALMLALPLVLSGCARAPDSDSDMLAEIMDSQRASMAALGRPMPPATTGRASAPAPAGRGLDNPASGRGLESSTSGRGLESSASGRSLESPASGRSLESPASGRGAPGGRSPAESSAFIGATPEILRRWLGEPRLQRMEGEAQVWLYQASACHLDLVLYPDRGALRVAYAAARASGTERRTEAACLSELTRPVLRAGG